MDFFEKEEYNIDDITALIDNEAEESVHLDFKAAGALSKDDKKKTEIAKDVSAFANSDGGIIVYGIEEQEHKAHALSYIDGNTYTKEWLEQVIQDNIQRRIEGLEIFPIRNNGDITKSIYIVKIPRSSNTPHMSADKCYYKRNNFRSVKMEEYEVRDLFYRESTPNLKIAGYILYDQERDEEVVKYHFEAQIWNDSNTIATLYKLNCYINNYIGVVNISWEPIKDEMNYTILNSSRLKIFQLGKYPLFPNESVDMLRFSLEIKRENVEAFINNATIELLLMFGNKTDKLSFSVKEHLER
ncbi:MAG: ATP-binding protein [Bacteroidales bacterium]|nr:ATP-binding protein [Bacteroidales bacterium]